MYLFMGGKGAENWENRQKCKISLFCDCVQTQWLRVWQPNIFWEDTYPNTTPKKIFMENGKTNFAPPPI